MNFSGRNERGIKMKKIINTIRERVTEEGIMWFVGVMAAVIILGMMFYEFASIRRANSDFDGSIIDGRLEVIEEYTDDLMTAVVEFNQAYYTAIYGDFNELSMTKGDS